MLGVQARRHRLTPHITTRAKAASRPATAPTFNSSFSFAEFIPPRMILQTLPAHAPLLAATPLHLRAHRFAWICNRRREANKVVRFRQPCEDKSSRRYSAAGGCPDQDNEHRYEDRRPWQHGSHVTLTSGSRRLAVVRNRERQRRYRSP